MSAQNYLVLERMLPRQSFETLSALLRNEKSWKLHEESFFSQNDVSWVRREFGRPPMGTATLEMAELLTAGKKLIEARMNAVVGAHHTLVGHKMVPDQVIGIHNDSPDMDRGRIENFRLIHYFDENYSDDKGGLLLIFGSRDAQDIIDAIRPLSNSAIVIQLSDDSYHAVSRVLRSVRYSLVASYWGYPLLCTEAAESQRVERCLRRIIELGYEEVPHSGTTFAYHLYHTFRLLHDWGFDIDICLAGLMHSLLGRRTSGVAASNVEQSELHDLVGEKAFFLIKWLETHSGFVPNPDLSIEIATALQVVELANFLEQSRSLTDLSCAEAHLAKILITPETRLRISADINKVRSSLKYA